MPFMLARPHKNQIAWRSHTPAHFPQPEQSSAFTSNVIRSLSGFCMSANSGRKYDILLDKVALESPDIYISRVYTRLCCHRSCCASRLSHGHTERNDVKHIIGNQV